MLRYSFTPCASVFFLPECPQHVSCLTEYYFIPVLVISGASNVPFTPVQVIVSASYELCD